LKNSTTFVTGNVHDNCYLYIHLLPTHPHLASVDFIRFLSIATFTDLHILLLPIAVQHSSQPVSGIHTIRKFLFLKMDSVSVCIH